MHDFLKKNLILLEKKSPEICSLVKNTVPEIQHIIKPSKMDIPTLSTIYPDGTRRTIHSTYDPEKEAINFIKPYIKSKKPNYIICGLGLGYHLLELIKNLPLTAKVMVVEKSPSMARMAFTYKDFSLALNHPGVSFYIGADPEYLEKFLVDERTNIAIHGYTLINFKPAIELNETYYSLLKKELTQVHQKFQIDINTQAVYSKKFFKNIFNNGSSIINSPGINSLKEVSKGLPAIMVSAGPSLDKNINLIKSARKNIIIFSVATALKPLLKNNIEPDFVVAVDPNEVTLEFFNIETIPKNLCLIFDPCIPPAITHIFKGRSIVVDSNISLAKWLSEHNEKKGSLGNISSVAHSAFHISKIMGCNPIILVGQDLSFTGNRMHCSDSHYNQASQDRINKDLTLNLLEYKKYSKYSPSIKQTINIFDEYSNTTKAMETYQFQFKSEINENPQILNATEGGVNIDGAKNLSLREALHKYCKKNKQIFNSIEYLKVPKPNKALNNAVVKQKYIFDQIYSELEKITSVFFKSKKTSINRTNFVQKMEDIYKHLINDATTLHLMQGYNYLGFIEWNRMNQKIIIGGGNTNKKELLNQKYIRDHAFLAVLKEAAKSLSHGFDHWIDIDR